MSLLRQIILTVLLAVASSCSVKEDRSECLCCLGLDYSECNDNASGVVLIGWDGSMSESFRDVPDPGARDAYREYFVPRCDFTLSASSGAEITDGRYIMLRSGEQADSLYASLNRFRTDGEYCYRKLCLSKQFTTVRIINAAGEDLQDSIIVKGNTAGIYLPDMVPVPGDYTFTVQKLPGGVFPFRLYRQSGQIEVRIPSSRPGGRTKVLDLSGILEKCGYDWSESSLRDVDLYIDKSMMSISVKISGWDFAGSIIVEI